MEMSSNMRIRSYEPVRDLDRVRVLHDRSIRALSGHLHPPEVFDRMQQRKEGEEFAVNLASIHFFVAEDEAGRLLCTAGWQAEPELALARIREVFVEPDLARRGIASAMLRHVEADAIANGRTEFWLMSSVVAVPFYQRQGYEVEGEATDSDLPAIPMGKRTKR